MRNIRYIYLHCSDSDWGDAEEIRRWHKARGWSDIGYHYVILNAYPDYASIKLCKPQIYMDGVVEGGRSVKTPGAHVSGHNGDSIGVCLVGKNTFTAMQMFALRNLLIELLAQFPLATLRGHYEAHKTKTCPNIDMDYLREWLKTS